MKRLLLCGLVLSIVGFAPAPFPRPARRESNRTDLELLQGEWTVVRMIRNGVADPEATSYGVRFQGTSFWVLVNGVKAGEGTFTLDTTHRPPTLHLKLAEKDNSQRFVYRVNRQRLLLCGDSGGSKTLPQDLAPGQERDYIECTRSRR